MGSEVPSMPTELLLGLRYDITSELRKPAAHGDQKAQEVGEKGTEDMLYSSRAGPQ